MARAHDAVTTWGFTVAAIDAPGHGDRPRTAEDEQARADLAAGDGGGRAERARSSARATTPHLAERAVPEWQATLDALQELPEIGDRSADRLRRCIIVGHRDRDTADGDRTQDHRRDLRWRSVVHEPLIEAARRITVPIEFLLPWDDEHIDRQSALALFDAFASKEKTLHANPGDHPTCAWFEVDSAARFFARHLGRVGTSPA